MLPTRHYVYFHVDPFTDEVRYVGAGSGGRAWSCSHSPKSEGGRRGARSNDHYEWLISLFDHGFTMGDIVDIIAQGLTRQEALNHEKDIIKAHDIDILFNKPRSCHALVLSMADVSEAHLLRNTGTPYHLIADSLNVSTMTIYRALNNQTEGYRV